MKKPDLSVIVTAHDEAFLSGPTMHAAQAAVADACAHGITTECIVVLDNADDATKTWFSQPAFADWTQHVLEEGDLGRARNAILPETRGKYIAFLDADDLFSQNWLTNGVARMRQAEEAGTPAVVHPELNWLFDGAHSVFLKPDQDDPLFTPYHFYFTNYYDSLAMAPRDAHEHVPYVHRDIPAGLSFQDWQFSIETMAAGWKHVSAPDTIIFKRRRDSSLVSESRTRRAIIRDLDVMAIDRIADLAGPRPDHTHLPAPKPKNGVHPWSLLQSLGLAKPDTSDLPPDSRPEIPDGAVSYYGGVFENRISRATDLTNRTVLKKKRIHDVIKTRFDVPYYLARHLDMAQAERLDPISHYIRAGAREGRDPSPLFSTKAYLRRYPDVAKSGENPFYHWLTKGYGEGRIGVPYHRFSDLSEAVGLTPQVAQDLWIERYRNLRQRLEYGELGRQVTLATEHEPLVGQGWNEALAVKQPPFHSQMVVERTAAMFAMHKAADHRRAKYIICVNRARWGDSRRLEGQLAHALAALHGAENVLLVTTESGGRMAKGKLPDGVRVVDLAGPAGDLKGDHRQRLLVEFLRSLKPDCVFNVNSRLLWDCMTPYGKAMSTSMRIIGTLLCNELTTYGYWTGYALTRFYRNFDVLDSVCTDSHFLAKDIGDRFCLTPDQTRRLHVLSAPVNPAIPVAPRPAQGARPTVFWSGRLDPQKRPDLIYAIARAMPHVDFRLWGESVLGTPMVLPPKPDNLTLMGVYERFANLPMAEADLWLYTSAWDGVPQILLEVAMTGVPIVGSAVGGTPEVLRPDLSPSLGPDADVAAWCAAIQSVVDDPNGARQKALSLREIMVRERTEESYVATIAALTASPAPHVQDAQDVAPHTPDPAQPRVGFNP